MVSLITVTTGPVLMAGSIFNFRKSNGVKEPIGVAMATAKMIRNPSKDSVTDFFVVGTDNKLIGFFTLRDLLNVLPNAKAIQIIREQTPKVLLDASCEKIANLMDHEHLSTVPVVDEQNTIHGIITFDDVFRGLKQTADEEIYTMVGATEADPFAKRTSRKIAARAPWLFTTFIGGMISAFVLKSFETKARNHHI